MNTESYTLIGPFRQLLPMANLADKGPLADDQVEVIPEAGVLVQAGNIAAIGKFEELRQAYKGQLTIEEISEDLVALPGFIDAHTHICFAGSRANDYAMRNAGKSYLEIAREGGGIWSTVTNTRQADEAALVALMTPRIQRLLRQGITTAEVKSGYGLNTKAELRMLRAIRQAATQSPIDLVSTCLAAHMVPRDFEGSATDYLNKILTHLVPEIQAKNLCSRFDIFIEESAFSPVEAAPYLLRLKELGFAITVHGDQFSAGGSKVAVEVGAMSVDHLEVSGNAEIALLAQSEVIPVALPGASIGLGCDFAPARSLLDSGCSLAIASDWNPGSAPQGNLLAQAALLGTFEKLSNAEVFAGISYRAALALGLSDRGKLEKGMLADMVAFPCQDHREILYQQGSLAVCQVWKKGIALQ